MQQRYMLQLQAALTPMNLPQYLQEFLAQVWSQALVLAARRDGPESDRAKRYRRVGTDLVMSVQPKGSPMFRKKFLMQLPPLMKDLNEGMKLIGWPEAAQKEFFGKLLPAHAESLKGQPLSRARPQHAGQAARRRVRDPGAGRRDLLARRAGAGGAAGSDGAPLHRGRSAADRPGRRGDGRLENASTKPARSTSISAPSRSRPSRRRRRCTRRSIPRPRRSSARRASEGGDAGEPTRGPQLMDHIQLGFAYQMHLKDEWQKVRLAHVSPGRSFFVFTRGGKHQETISMTARMLARMCETGRFRAVESAYLMERATARARKQLAELKAPPAPRT